MYKVKWRQWNTIPNADNDLISKSALLADISESVVFSGRSGETSAEMRGAHKVVDRIKAAPTVDAVEVVRCAKCKHYDERFNPNTNNYCYVDGGRTHRIMPPNGFCSYGERRSE